jgi:hypothetical protein
MTDGSLGQRPFSGNAGEGENSGALPADIEEIENRRFPVDKKHVIVFGRHFTVCPPWAVWAESSGRGRLPP